MAEFVDDVAEHFDHHLAANPLIQRWNKLEACVLGAAVNGAKAAKLAGRFVRDAGVGAVAMLAYAPLHLCARTRGSKYLQPPRPFADFAKTNIKDF